MDNQKGLHSSVVWLPPHHTHSSSSLHCAITFRCFATCGDLEGALLPPLALSLAAGALFSLGLELSSTVFFPPPAPSCLAVLRQRTQTSRRCLHLPMLQVTNPSIVTTIPSAMANHPAKYAVYITRIIPYLSRSLDTPALPRCPLSCPSTSTSGSASDSPPPFALSLALLLRQLSAGGQNPLGLATRSR